MLLTLSLTNRPHLAWFISFTLEIKGCVCLKRRRKFIDTGREFSAIAAERERKLGFVQIPKINELLTLAVHEVNFKKIPKWRF